MYRGMGTSLIIYFSMYTGIYLISTLTYGTLSLIVSDFYLTHMTSVGIYKTLKLSFDLLNTYSNFEISLFLYLSDFSNSFMLARSYLFADLSDSNSSYFYQCNGPTDTFAASSFLYCYSFLTFSL